MKRMIIAVFLLGMGSSAFAGALGNWQLRWMNSPSGSSTLYNSADHPDGIFVVEGYFNECPYCNANAVNVDAVATAYASNARVQVLDVGDDCRDSDYAAWIQAHNPNHPVLNDCNGATILNALGVSSYPTTTVLDCNKNIIVQTVGEWDSGTQKQITDAIDGLVSKTCVPQ